MSDDTMRPVEHTIVQYAHGEKWPTGLVGLAEAAAGIGLPAERLLELTQAGYTPHWRIDGGPPLYRLTDLRQWGARNLAQCCEGRPLPVRFEINVDPLPCNTAPRSIRDIPELAELPNTAQPGVYFLVQGDEVVYVGQSISPLNRIGAHGLNSQKAFDRVFIVPVPQSLLNAVEGALIRWLKPKLNTTSPQAYNQERDHGVLEELYGHKVAFLATEKILA